MSTTGHKSVKLIDQAVTLGCGAGLSALEINMTDAGNITACMRQVLREIGLDTVKQELTQMNTILTVLQTEQVVLKTSLTNTQMNIGETNVKLGILTLENINLKERLEFSENKMAHMERALENCEKRVLDIQARNMSDNLIFHNIPEERRENTMEVILSFMVEVMNISRDSFTTNRLDIDDPVGKTVWIKRCHMLGTKQPGTSKPQGATRMTAPQIAPQGTTRMTAPQIAPQGTARSTPQRDEHRFDMHHNSHQYVAQPYEQQASPTDGTHSMVYDSPV